uniref:Uncharacterized protein n=1 Tax=Tetranychus urticae TaxID=32264 RepID=T1L3H3_TETUR
MFDFLSGFKCILNGNSTGSSVWSTVNCYFGRTNPESQLQRRLLIFPISIRKYLRFIAGQVARFVRISGCVWKTVSLTISAWTSCDTVHWQWLSFYKILYSYIYSWFI